MRKESSIGKRESKENGPGSSVALLSGPFFSDVTSHCNGDFVSGFEVKYQLTIFINYDVADHGMPERIIMIADWSDFSAASGKR